MFSYFKSIYLRFQVRRFHFLNWIQIFLWRSCKSTKWQTSWTIVTQTFFTYYPPNKKAKKSNINTKAVIEFKHRNLRWKSKKMDMMSLWRQLLTHNKIQIVWASQDIQNHNNIKANATNIDSDQQISHGNRTLKIYITWLQKKKKANSDNRRRRITTNWRSKSLTLDVLKKQKRANKYTLLERTLIFVTPNNFFFFFRKKHQTIQRHGITL